MKTRIKRFLIDTLLMFAGSALIAVAVNGFLRPHGLIAGGMSGASLIVYYNWQGIPFSLLYLIVNTPVFLLGFFVVGRKFILYSIWAALIHSGMFQFIVPAIVIPDKFLSVFIAGVLGGTGLALILRTNGTSSGTEIISIVVNKFYSINLGVTSVIMNAFLLLVASIFLPLDSVLYSFVYVVMNSVAMNAVSKGLAKRKVVMVISKKWKEILDILTHEKRVGATLMSAKGGYTGSDEPIIYSIVKSHQVSTMRAVATRVDPAAFMVIMEATDIINDTVGNQPPWKKQLYRCR